MKFWKNSEIYYKKFCKYTLHPIVHFCWNWNFRKIQKYKKFCKYALHPKTSFIRSEILEKFRNIRNFANMFCIQKYPSFVVKFWKNSEILEILQIHFASKGIVHSWWNFRKIKKYKKFYKYALHPKASFIRSEILEKFRNIRNFANTFCIQKHRSFVVKFWKNLEI